MTAPKTENKSFTAPTPGLIALTSHGSLKTETVGCLLESVRLTERSGLQQIQYQMFGGALVDKARNDACRTMLQGGFAWVVFVDGDMTFPPQAILQLIQTAYGQAPWADVVGGYCVLRGGAVPTIDTGTGTWESHFPGSGIMEVMRTGGAFLLVKRHVCERLTEPWFSVRNPIRWLDALYEVDNLTRVMFDGENPLRGEHWDKMIAKAASDPQAGKTVAGYEVGEDSGFCDRVKAAGFRIAVDTNIEIGHLDQVILNGKTHFDRMQEKEKHQRQLHGVLI